ncbi:tRNA lysidine(34) synthetase TilS [Gordonia sp. NB41Y]|uniref:tRNA lysidine(34) synthetase TilS n=1 Tax=Gordonia sp. NB41Y TaxID=875808 RepID=UPI0006B1B038|nr:tRNA lysidine(34) synthetase TilS [Gordonia sp. NB41Y]KOY50058.1 tRNA(Ile)-lysidine synthetase [Gordonia sp. NB41Y]WLP89194.1 tRNA lysidine(34) synthetase TilS [Gordonia sp. NB41Y]
MDRAGALTRAVAAFAADHLRADEVCVGLSGGPDSLALTAAAVHAGLSVRALVVDHRLQHGSADVATAAARAARALGARAEVLEVSVGHDGGMEAAARDARYTALELARDGLPVLLAHTMDDQAETVLLGLARGSGSRSIAGMRPWSPPWGRPLLGLRRADTVGACADWGLAPHTDPHNSDPRFTRVRLRAEVIPLLEDVLHGGVVEALARTASALQGDNDALDDLAEQAYRAAGSGEDSTELGVGGLADLPDAVRTRVFRRWLYDVGATGPTSRVIGAVDALAVGRTRGHVAIGGTPQYRRVVCRVGDRLTITDLPR